MLQQSSTKSMLDNGLIIKQWYIKTKRVSRNITNLHSSHYYERFRKNLFRSHCIRNDGAANVHEQGVSLFSGLVLAWSSLPTIFFFLQIYSLIHDLTIKYGHFTLTNSVQKITKQSSGSVFWKFPRGLFLNENVTFHF